MRENRAKAIDFLAINLRFADPTGGGDGGARAGLTGPGEEDVWGWEDAGLEWDIDEPWLIFDNLTLEDMDELSGDIKMYLSLEKAPVNIEFWEVSPRVERPVSDGHVWLNLPPFATPLLSPLVHGKNLPR